jgi:hypothetical protein
MLLNHVGLTRGTRVGLLVAGALSVGVPASAAASEPVHAPAAPLATLQSAPDDGLTIATEYLKQWRVGSDQPRLLLPKSAFAGPSTRNYTLKGTVLRKFLQWEHQDWGINLGWTDDAEPATAARVKRWFFTRSGAGDGPIRYGETIAIGNGGDPSFIRYAERPFGINLKWSEGPVFEWRILGGRIGEAVRTNDPVAIFNAKNGQCLIYFDQNVGGDIGWPTSERWEDQVTEAISAAMREHGKEALLALLLG